MTLSRSSLYIDLADSLQLIQSKKVTILLEVASEGIAGHIWVKSGEIIHAKVKDLIGERAIMTCLGWSDCVITELPYKTPPQQSVTHNAQELIFQASASKDEKKEVGTGESFNLNNAVEIGKNVWWVGHRKEGSPLQINVYLKKFEKPGSRPIWLVIDPGSQAHFPDISRRISEIVDFSKIQLFSVNHQDPDVCSNAIFLTEMNPNAICISTETTARLLVHYGIQKFWYIEDKKWILRLVTGHTIKFFPTPFCHFAGAFGLYDVESGIVFTGDLFGATSIHVTEAPLMAIEEQWRDLVTFHSIYMPNNEAIKYSIAKMKETCGIPKVIAPQHGGIIKGPMVEDWMNRLEELPVGIDLLGKEIDDNLPGYQAVVADMLQAASEIDGGITLESLMANNAKLTNFVQPDGAGGANIMQKPPLAIAELKKAIIKGMDRGKAAIVKAAVIRALRVRQLPALPADQAGDDEQLDAIEEILLTEEE